MNIEYAHQLVKQYEEGLKDLAPMDYPFDEGPDGRNLLLGVPSMLTSMHAFLYDNKIGKFNRWLGFVQAMLFSGGIYTINEMREHNRPLED